MAQTMKPPLAACLLLLLSIIILSQQIHSIEAARPFNKLYQNILHNASTTKGRSSVNVAHAAEAVTGAVPPPPAPAVAPGNPATGQPQQPPTPASPGRGTDDFRPTTPGHSPGVGHSTHN